MEEKVRVNGFNPYVLLATHLNLSVFSNNPLVFVDEEGKKFVHTKYGFSSLIRYSHEQELIKTKESLRKTEAELEKVSEELVLALKKLSGDDGGEGTIGRRRMKRIKKILKAQATAEIKVEQISLYLTGKDVLQKYENVF